MAKHVLSIEIGQQVTKVVEIDYRKKNPHVYRAITFATPEDVIDDGFIRDKDSLAVAFREQLSGAGFREKNVVFSIASTKIATREVTLPDVKENKVGALVAATAQDYFPVDLSNYSVAYSILDNVKEEDGSKSLKVMLLAAPDSLVENYYSFAETMGYNIESIDYFGAGSMQVLKNEIVGSYCACIQISGSNSTINIMNEGQQMMQRTVSYGVFTIADAIVQDPDNSLNDLDVACDQLTRNQLLCRTLDYEGLEEISEGARMTEDQYTSAAESQSARKVATDACGDLIMSVVRVLDFFRSQNPGVMLSGIYITGMGVKVLGIDELFSSEISVPIHKMEHLVSVMFPRKFGDTLYNQTEYIAVIGAAINPVGFKSSNVTETAKTVNLVPFYAVLGVAVAASIGLSAFSIIRYNKANDENKELKTRKESLSYIESVYNTNTNINTVDESMKSMYASTRNMNEFLQEIIYELEDKIPTNMSLESFSSNETGVTFSIVSKTDISVAKLIMNLEKDYNDPEDETGVSGITNIQVTGLTHETDAWTCSLSADYIGVSAYEELIEIDPSLKMGKPATKGAVSKADADEDEDDADTADTEATEEESTDDTEE